MPVGIGDGDLREALLCQEFAQARHPFELLYVVVRSLKMYQAIRGSPRKECQAQNKVTMSI